MVHDDAQRSRPPKRRLSGGDFDDPQNSNRKERRTEDSPRQDSPRDSDATSSPRDDDVPICDIPRSPSLSPTTKAEPSTENENVSAPSHLPVSLEEFLRPDLQEDGQTYVITSTSLSERQDLPPNVGFGPKHTLIRIGDEEAAFLLGRGGRTKQKIARVSGCRVTLSQNLVLDLSGTAEARRRAELYVKLVIQQRQGPVLINFGEQDRSDLTAMRIPASCVAFVTGQRGFFLRSIEEEWQTLMFFVRHVDDENAFFSFDNLLRRDKHEPYEKKAKEDDDSSAEFKNAENSSTHDSAVSGEQPVESEHWTSDQRTSDYSVPPRRRQENCDLPEEPIPDANSPVERLLIFGDQRGRRGAELKVMSTVEQKFPRLYSCAFSEGEVEHESEDYGFATDRIVIAAEDFSYALGKDGGTRRKLGRAAHCILEYVGRIAFLAGTKVERQRCRDYLRWLVQQRTRAIHVDTSGRDDVLSLIIPRRFVRVVSGSRGCHLRRLEQETETFCFFDAIAADDSERLHIFSYSQEAREAARRIVFRALDDAVERGLVPRVDDRGGTASRRGASRPATEYIYREPICPRRTVMPVSPQSFPAPDVCGWRGSPRFDDRRALDGGFRGGSFVGGYYPGRRGCYGPPPLLHHGHHPPAAEWMAYEGRYPDDRRAPCSLPPESLGEPPGRGGQYPRLPPSHMMQGPEMDMARQYSTELGRQDFLSESRLGGRYEPFRYGMAMHGGFHHDENFHFIRSGYHAAKR